MRSSECSLLFLKFSDLNLKIIKSTKTENKIQIIAVYTQCAVFTARCYTERDYAMASLSELSVRLSACSQQPCGIVVGILGKQFHG